ncbi:MAG: PKD domain-containing protein [Bacteroidota bacterium]
MKNILLPLILIVLPYLLQAQCGNVLDELTLNQATPGLTALSPGAKFGHSPVAIGDLDGDGLSEIAIGAPEDDSTGVGKGIVYILFLDVLGNVNQSVKIGEGIGGLQASISGDAWFGYAIDSLGDFDGDNVPDLLVGAPRQNELVTRDGAVFILLLKADGTVKNHYKISQTTGNLNQFLQLDDRFGQGVARLGDLDGDSIPEIAVGIAGLSANSPGAVFTLFLNADGTVKPNGAKKIIPGLFGFSGPLGAGDQFGSSLSNMGDLDGDGIVDLAVGCPRNDASGTDMGSVWILFLNADGSVKASQNISKGLGGFTGNASNNGWLGTGVSRMEDLDGDGVDELLVGEPLGNEGGSNHGRIWIMYMNIDGTVKAQDSIGDLSGNFSGSLFINDFFGWGVGGLGDWDGDGLQEIIVGTPGSDDGMNNTGKAWILTLEGCMTTPTFTCQDWEPGADFQWVQVADTSGEVQFQNVSTGDSSASWTWTFGDGDTLFGSVDSIVTHVYDSSGTYDVCLISQVDSMGLMCQDTFCLTISVSILDPLTCADLDIQSNFLWDGFLWEDPVMFIDQSTGGDRTQSLWLFGNGTDSLLATPGDSVSYTYPAPGVYTACLVVIADTMGLVCRDTFCQSVEVIINSNDPVASWRIQGISPHPDGTGLLLHAEGILPALLDISMVDLQGRGVPISWDRGNQIATPELSRGLYILSFSWNRHQQIVKYWQE